MVRPLFIRHTRCYWSQPFCQSTSSHILTHSEPSSIINWEMSSARGIRRSREQPRNARILPLSLSRPGSNIRGSQSSGVAISKWGTPRILRSEPSNSLGKARYASPVHLGFISNYLNRTHSLFPMFLVFKGDCRTHQVPKVSQKSVPKSVPKNFLKCVP